MEYAEFVEKVVSIVKKDMGIGFMVSVQQITKLNNVMEDAFIIQDKNQEIRWLPLIYLKPYFERYEQGESMEECVMKIEKDYQKYLKDEKEIDGTMDIMSSWSKVKNHVYPILISWEDNKKLLSELVYKTVLDLAMCYIVRHDTNRFGSIKINKALWCTWGVSRNELHYQAMENMRKDGYGVTGMEDMIAELAPELSVPGRTEKPEDMYIVTNRDKWYGAAGMFLDVHFLTYKFGLRNFYILPSSIHEVILVPDRRQRSAEELSCMVQEVNREQVDPEERLSDHAYYYDLEKGEIQIAA